MTLESHDQATLSAIAPLRAAGFALHWLHPRAKRPIGNDWSESPVASLDDLRRTHQSGNNLGVRLGEPSRVGGGYLLVLDMDIRVADLADEAWDAFARLFPDVDPETLPCVASGSGGESRHLYLISDKPFRSKKLAVSEGKHRHFDKTANRDVWSYDWEIELFGTDKQVAMPPSIHPETGKPYTWLREFDFDMLDLGIGPFIPAADIEAHAVAQHATYDFESREPLTFTPKQLDRTLSDIPLDRIDDRNDWVMLGQALHHQFGGSEEGFRLWMEHSKRGSKYLVGSSETKELRRYRGFGKNRTQPVTMATIVQWAQEARVDSLRDAFEDMDDPAPKPSTPAADAGDLDDLLGGDTITPAKAPKSDLDLLGGDDDDDEVASLLAGRNDWMSLFDLNEEGTIKPTLPNIELMLNHDPRLIGLAQLNEFTQETVQRETPGTKTSRRGAAKPTRQLTGRIWNVRDTLNGELWSDDRDFAIRATLEAPKTQGGYGIKVSDRDLKAAVVLAANNNAFHPVREYLEAQTWDGVPRVDSLFTTYVGAPDDAYSRSVSRMMLVAAVTRIFEPGHKFDFAVILEGLQGKRKSTFIQVLGKKWFAELDGDFHDPKQMVELMQGAWIMEIPELSGFGRADVRSIKAFISRQRDRARLAYARRAGEFPRQCIFIGSTNDREYLKDDTGGRRFWPMLCTFTEIDIEGLEANVDQIWAEAITIYREMRAAQPFGTLPLYLTDPEARSQAARLQESRRVESADDGMAGRIYEWLTQPINTGSIDDDTIDGKPIYRTETCLQELWVDCLRNDLRSYQQTSAQMVGRAMRLVPGWELCSIGSGKRRFPIYGQQRFYSLGGDEGYLQRLSLLPK